MKINSLLFLTIMLVFGTVYAQEFSVAQTAVENAVKKLYGPDNLGAYEAFAGGYINFGYWQGINYADSGLLTEADRATASRNLYELIFNKLNPGPDDKILEVGCGIGYGAVYLLNHYSVASLIAMDITPEQIDRAKNVHAPALIKFPNLSFAVGSADSILKPDHSFTKIYSVEAIQHFYSVNDFAKEAARLLVPGGKVIITAHLPTNAASLEVKKSRMPFIADSDRDTPVTIVREAFKNNGFQENSFESIGQYVFYGLDSWLAKLKIDDTDWKRNFVKLFKDGYMDYYVLVYTKIPQHENRDKFEL